MQEGNWRDIEKVFQKIDSYLYFLDYINGKMPKSAQNL